MEVAGPTEQAQLVLGDLRAWEPLECHLHLVKLQEQEGRWSWHSRPLEAMLEGVAQPALPAPAQAVLLVAQWVLRVLWRHHHNLLQELVAPKLASLVLLQANLLVVEVEEAASRSPNSAPLAPTGCTV